MIILSMDLSLNLPAFAVGEVVAGQYKLLKSYYVDNKKKATLSQSEKLFRIKHTIELIKKDYPKVDYVVREKGFSRFAKVTQTLFKVVGVSDLMGLELFGVKDIAEIPPTSVKSLIGGYGKATKDEVEVGVRELLPKEQKDIEFYSDDVSDAIAVGMAFSIKKGYIQ